MAAPGEPHPGRPRRGPAGPDPRPQRRGARRQPDLRAGHHRPPRCSTSSSDDERADVLDRAGRRAGPHRASPTHRRGRSRSGSPTAVQPLHAGAGRRRRPRGARDLDRRARRRASRRRAGERVAVRHYPYGRLAAHVLGYVGQINDEEFEAQGRLAEAVHAQRRDREVRRRADLRGRPAGHARASRSIEVDAEDHPIRDGRGRPARPRRRRRPQRSTSTCRPQAEQALQSRARARPDRPCAGCQPRPTAAGGLDRRARPEDRRRDRHGVVPRPSTRPTSSTASATPSGPRSPTRRTTTR